MVALITNNTWLKGDGFVGLRQFVRMLGDNIWTVDLGGDNRGANNEPNVFSIETPVAITAVVRSASPRGATPAAANYLKIDGETGEQKRVKVSEMAESVDLMHWPWRAASPGWMDDLVPLSGGRDWNSFPKLADIFPWQQPGCMYSRLWTIAPDQGLLERRWRWFVCAPVAERPNLYHTPNHGRNIFTRVGRLPRLADLSADAPSPAIRPYGYRSFDIQWGFEDPRLAKTESPSLWAAQGVSQIYLCAAMTKATSAGPICTVSAHVPDKDYFRGSFGGKDILPLYRDASVKLPNITRGLLSLLADRLGIPTPAPEDLAAYSYVIVSALRYQRRFELALADKKGPRIPMTRDPALWSKAVALGKRLLWLHTYTERLRDPAEGRGDTLPAVPGLAWMAPVTQMPVKPSNIKYDAKKQVLTVGNGTVAGVRPDVWGYSVSGMQVVPKWLGYRTEKGAGKAASSTNPLDKIRLSTWPDQWSKELIELLTVLTITMDLQPEQAALLDAICDGPLIPAAELPKPTAAERKEPKVTKSSGPKLF